MKRSQIQILLLASCILGCGIVLAQDRSDESPDQPPRHHRPPPPPILLALDVNHDGILDAAEIANASAALLTLDKNGDGQLTRDELCPPCPEHGHPPDTEGPDGPPP